MSGYQYKLKESKYALKSNHTQKTKDDLEALYNNLIDFQTVVLNNVYAFYVCSSQKKTLPSRKKKQQNPDIKVIETISQITRLMDSIYKSMLSLGFSDLEKYKEYDDDLVFDLRELSGYFDRKRCEFFNQKADQIDDFRNRRNLNGQVSDKATHRRLMDLFSKFKQF